LFIELSEFLRCPEPHDETFCVVVPDAMVGRLITRGVVGCPICRREYRIEDGIVHFERPGATSPSASGSVPAPDPDAIHALLGLTSPGGFVALVGSAARLAEPLAERMEGVHFVGINAPADIVASPALSLLVHPDAIPLRPSMARGVVLGLECAREPWVAEGARVLLPGLRLVAQAGRLAAPDLDRVAVGRGLWVGRKMGKGERGKGKGSDQATTDNR
jgi:uncharacterized protein YbaR (Trm112 family)